MTDETESIVLEILKKLQDGQVRLEKSQSEMRADVKAGFKETHDRLVAMDNYMAAFHTTQAYQSGAIAELQVRLDRVEKRLGLFDPALDDE